MLQIGLPAALQMLAMALAEIVLLSLVNRHGSTATAAYGAATQVLSWVQFPAMSLGIAAAIFSAHAVGAGRRERLPAIVATGLRVNAMVTPLFVVAAHLLAPLALCVFLEPGPVLELSVTIVRTLAWSVLLRGWSNVVVGAMRASGAAARQARDAFPPMGIHAIRDRESDHLLLGASRNVHASLNRARFELLMGKHADRVLQAAWNHGGADGLRFDVLELLKERENAEVDYEDELKALEEFYRELHGLTP